MYICVYVCHYLSHKSWAYTQSRAVSPTNLSKPEKPNSTVFLFWWGLCSCPHSSASIWTASSPSPGLEPLCFHHAVQLQGSVASALMIGKRCGSLNRIFLSIPENIKEHTGSLSILPRVPPSFSHVFASFAMSPYQDYGLSSMGRALGCSMCALLLVPQPPCRSLPRLYHTR